MSNPLRDPSRQGIQRAKVVVAGILCSAPVGAATRVATRGIVPSRGLRFDTRSRAITDTNRASLLWGLYEGAEVRLLAEHMQPTGCVVDLGASLGVLSSFAASRMAPGSRVIGVEANPSLLELCQENITRNASHVDVAIIHGAVDYSSPSGAAVRFTEVDDHTATTLGGDGPGFDATAVRLSELLRTHGVGDYTLLADIEGAEAGLLVRDAEALENCRQMVIEFHDTEFDGQKYTPDELLNLAMGAGFRVDASYGSVSVLNRV